jgi:hypothetical protein
MYWIAVLQHIVKLALLLAVLLLLIATIEWLWTGR